MKKNVMMRVAAMLLVCVLASTCGISGTFAKYVTDGSSNDTARVAKFGVVVTGTVDDANQMFSKEYAKTDLSYTESAVTVASTVNVVAPGTDGNFSNFAVTGTPEVAVRITYAVTEFSLTNWVLKDGTTEYCPIVIYINDVPYYINGVDIKTVDELEAAVISAIQNTTNDYAPGTNLSVVDNDLRISWAWAFEGGVGQTDIKDTELGDRAADGEEIKITLNVTCTVTQID